MKFVHEHNTDINQYHSLHFSFGNISTVTISCINVFSLSIITTFHYFTAEHFAIPTLFDWKVILKHKMSFFKINMPYTWTNLVFDTETQIIYYKPNPLPLKGTTFITLIK